MSESLDLAFSQCQGYNLVMPGPLRIIFIVFGSILLMSGIRFQSTLAEQGSNIVPYVMIVVGAFLNFLALKSIGDQKVKPSPRVSTDHKEFHEYENKTKMLAHNIPKLASLPGHQNVIMVFFFIS